MLLNTQKKASSLEAQKAPMRFLQRKTLRKQNREKSRALKSKIRRKKESIFVITDKNALFSVLESFGVSVGVWSFSFCTEGGSEAGLSGAMT